MFNKANTDQVKFMNFTDCLKCWELITACFPWLVSLIKFGVPR